MPFPATEEASTIDLAVVGPDRFGECNLVEEQCKKTNNNRARGRPKGQPKWWAHVKMVML